MSDVSFDEEPQYTPVHSYASAPSQNSKVPFLVRMGVVKTQRSAEIVLLSMAVVAIIAAIFVFIQTTSARKLPPPPPTTVIVR
ncbi:MAG: hypothetical protein ABIT47_01435 [Candidatus Paceibacterota bacterium]